MGRKLDNDSEEQRSILIFILTLTLSLFHAMVSFCFLRSNFDVCENDVTEIELNVIHTYQNSTLNATS